MKNRIVPLITTIVALFAILSTLGSFHIAPLDSVAKNPLTPFVKQEKELSLSYRTLSAGESRHYLDVNLLKEGIQPVQVTIQNNTPRAYAIGVEDLDIAQVSSKDAAWKIARHAIPRSILYKVISFFFPPFLVVETLDNIVTFKSHLDLKRDFHAKGFKDEGETILPYSTINRVVFVPSEEYQADFAIDITDVETGNVETFST